MFLIFKLLIVFRKAETILYDSKLRINGYRVPKKGLQVSNIMFIFKLSNIFVLFKLINITDWN